MGFSIPHLAMVLAITILVFGTKHLKSLGADLGGAIKGFRDAVKQGELEDQSNIDSQFTIDTKVSEPTGK